MDKNEIIKEIIKNCMTCKMYKKSLGKPKVEMMKVTDFNQVITIYLKQIDENNILYLICLFTKFVK